MPKNFAIRKDDKAFSLVSSESGKAIASLKIKGWETKFFKRKYGTLSIDHSVLLSLSGESIRDGLDALVLYADQEQYELVELHLDMSAIELIPVLEDKGFRLVDTRITFITLMEKGHIEKYSSDIGKVSLATVNDLEEILQLTHDSFTNNGSFFSRYKNRRYFTEKETERYYSAWIENHINDSNTLFAVLKREEKIIAYYIYKHAGSYKGKTVYKGILSAVVPQYQGHKAHLVMQSFLYDHFGEEKFYLDNTTQLTNLPPIKNHITSQKNLNRIELTFFRSKK